MTYLVCIDPNECDRSRVPADVLAVDCGMWLRLAANSDLIGQRLATIGESLDRVGESLAQAQVHSERIGARLRQLGREIDAAEAGMTTVPHVVPADVPSPYAPPPAVLGRTPAVETSIQDRPRPRTFPDRPIRRRVKALPGYRGDSPSADRRQRIRPLPRQ